MQLTVSIREHINVKKEEQFVIFLEKLKKKVSDISNTLVILWMA